MSLAGEGKRGPRSDTSVELERHEAKYLVHPSQVPALREFIRPFVRCDPHARGEPPEYSVTTLQLDSPEKALYLAKEYESLNRFKLRVRTYGSEPGCPVFLEIKRKIKGVVVKSRVAIHPDEWGPDVCLRPARAAVTLGLEGREYANYLEFVRLTTALRARPTMLIRYVRESYLGTNDNYSRVTFDRRLCYRPTREWDLLPQRGRWWPMDTAMALDSPWSGVVLELKTFDDAPLWMVELTERFSLTRIGFCKYFVAVRLDALFRGAYPGDGQEGCSWS
jgi:hypothetical protein